MSSTTLLGLGSAGIELGTDALQDSTRWSVRGGDEARTSASRKHTKDDATGHEEVSKRRKQGMPEGTRNKRAARRE